MRRNSARSSATHAPASPGQPAIESGLICPDCQQQFDTIQALHEHFETNHNHLEPGLEKVKLGRSLSNSLNVDGAMSFPFAAQDPDEHDKTCEIYENQECSSKESSKKQEDRNWFSPKTYPEWTDAAGVGVACPTDLSPPGTC